MTHAMIKNLEHRLFHNPGSIVLPEADDPRTLEAIEKCIEKNVIEKAVLLGEENKIRTSSSVLIKSYLNKGVLRIIDSQQPEIIEHTKTHLLQRLEAKNKIVSEKSLTAMANAPNYQAGYILSSNEVEACVAGAVYTTADVIRAGLAGVGLSKSSKFVSSSIILNKESCGQTLLFADCGVIIEPSEAQLCEIAATSVKTFQQLIPGITPKVAFLSFSTKGSADHKNQQKMQKASELFKTSYPHILSDGELQFDAAFDLEIGRKKAPNSKIAGRANVFIFPNLDAGNISYKIAQRLGGFDAFGPILQGFKKPYSDLSRGATSEDIFVSCMISMLLARNA